MAFVEHFEIPADDINRAQAFYKNVLEFDYEPWGDDMGMLNQPEGKGINGDLHERGATPHPTVVFTVDRLEEVLDKVIANGGSQIGEIQPLSDMGRWAYITDSEGNIVGLYDERNGEG
jgi:predicted enzyme related to lactoylglutathione lyase